LPLRKYGINGTKYREIRSFYLPSWITQTTKRAYMNQAFDTVLLSFELTTSTVTLRRLEDKKRFRRSYGQMPTKLHLISLSNIVFFFVLYRLCSEVNRSGRT